MKHYILILILIIVFNFSITSEIDNETNQIENKIEKNPENLFANITVPDGILINLIDFIQLPLVAILFLHFVQKHKINPLVELKNGKLKIFVGFLCQLVMMPILGFSLGYFLLYEKPKLWLMLFFYSLSPSDLLSNIWTYHFKGNVNLSTAMTMVNTFCSCFTIPFWSFTLGRIIRKRGDFGIQSSNYLVEFLFGDADKTYIKICTWAFFIFLALLAIATIKHYIPKTEEFICKWITRDIAALIYSIYFAVLVVFYFGYAQICTLYLGIKRCYNVYMFFTQFSSNFFFTYILVFPVFNCLDQNFTIIVTSVLIICCICFNFQSEMFIFGLLLTVIAFILTLTIGFGLHKINGNFFSKKDYIALSIETAVQNIGFISTFFGACFEENLGFFEKALIMQISFTNKIPLYIIYYCL